MIYHLLATSGSLCTTSTSLPNTSLVTTCPILLLQPNGNFPQTQVDSIGFWEKLTWSELLLSGRAILSTYIYIINFQIWTQVTLPDISLLNSPIHHLGRARLLTRILRFPGLHTKQWVARAFWQENPASLRESWRLCSTRAHESGSRVDSWNPKRNDWMLHCWTVFLLQGQRLHLHYFQGTGGALKRRERCARVDDLHGKGFTVLDL